MQTLNYILFYISIYIILIPRNTTLYQLPVGGNFMTNNRQNAHSIFSFIIPAILEVLHEAHSASCWVFFFYQEARPRQHLF